MVLAARGARKLNGEEESIADKTVTLRVQRQARKVHAASIITAALMTLLFLAVPL